MNLSKDGLRRAALTLAVVFAAIWYSVFMEEKTSDPVPAANEATGAISNNATLPGNQ